MIGKVIDGRYQVTRILGEGGMGAVYAAEHAATGRQVAVKTMRHENAPGPVVERFKREAHAMAALDHPHVVKIFDAGQDRETNEAFLVMELLKGRDLEKRIHIEGKLDERTAIQIAIQALEGLKAAHAQGIVHRDVKPPNLFLVLRDTGEIMVKVVDFGISRSLTAPESQLGRQVTREGGVIGTPPYMSPEQLGLGSTVDHRTDLWSMGVVLFEMLAGFNPYAKAPSLQVLMNWICIQPPPLLLEHAPEVSPRLAAIVTRAMSPNPADRYQSADDMLTDLTLLVLRPDSPSTAPMLAGPPRTTPPAVAMSAGSGPILTAERRTQERQRTRRLALIAAAIIGATMVLALIAVQFVPRRTAMATGPTATAMDLGPAPSAPLASASGSGQPASSPPLTAAPSATAAADPSATAKVGASLPAAKPAPKASSTTTKPKSRL